MTEPQALLAKFVQERSETAFRELVARYLDLVYSTAVRRVDGDTHRAKDIAQIVFADLARLSGKLSETSTLGGWLHRHTCFVARTVMRGERRRQARERQAAEMNELNQTSESLLAQAAPFLDEAIQQLGADDREAILLRFFERRSLRSVGEALGINENVAQKRVARAVQELRTLLQRQGVALSAAALASALAAGAVSAAPAGLVAVISATALSGTGVSSGAALATAKLSVAAKVKFALLCGLLVGGVLTTLWLAFQPKKTLSLAASPPVEQASSAEPPASLESPQPESSPPITSAQVRPAPIQPLPNPAPQVIEAAPTVTPAAPVASRPVPILAPISPRRFAARSGSLVRIRGTSNIHGWEVRGSLIGGELRVGQDFPTGMERELPPGIVDAEAEVFIPVRSLASVDQDGKPYSDKFNEIMYETLREPWYPKISYRLSYLSLTGLTNYHQGLQYAFESRGELTIAGVTNQIDMPVFAQPMGSNRLKLSGETILKMSSFQIQPPSPHTPLGVIKVGDAVAVSFEWMLAARNASSSNASNSLVPLALDLPAPQFTKLPADLKIDSEVEPFTQRQRPPVLVPSGVFNVAPGSRLTCSDSNVSSAVLSKIVDGDKEGLEPSIIYLRKGAQWVQMSWDRPQEISAILIWHGHNAAKIYHDVIVQTANDPGFRSGVRTLFNNDRDNSSGLGKGNNREYVETYEGKLVTTASLRAQHLRFYSRGSTESALNEYTEIEVYGRAVR